MLKEVIANWIYRNLADSWGGSESPPGSNQVLEFGELDEGKPMHTATTYNNDGHELWIAYTNWGKWQFHCRAEDARRLAWFILWTWWAKGTWFGLKRRLWYWALHIKVEGYKSLAKLNR
jgi:hypothetical protein